MRKREVERYVPACLERINPVVWVRARNAESIVDAYRIIKKVEDELPFPWPEPVEAMNEARRANRQVAVDIQRQEAWTVEEARERARLKRVKISPKKARPAPVVKRVRVEPKDIKVVRVAPPPKTKIQPMDGAEWERGWNHSPGGGRWRHLDKCYIGDVMEDGTYEYGPHNQPGGVMTAASEASAPTLAEWRKQNESDFRKWEEMEG